MIDNRRAQAPPTTTVGDPAQLLHVDVDELARASAFVAQSARATRPDDFTAHGVTLGQPRDPGPPQDPTHGAFGHAAGLSELGRPTTALPPQVEDQVHPDFVGRPGEAMGSAGTILEARHTFFVEAAHPTVRTLARDPHGLCRVGNRHALITNPLDQEQATPWGQSGITVRHEGLLVVMCANTTFLEVFALGQSVTKVLAGYS